jgi:tetratricopeptide (TPR) repeat protein
MRLSVDTAATQTHIIPDILDDLGYSPRDGEQLTIVHSAIGAERGYMTRVAKFSALGYTISDFRVHVHDLPEGVGIDGLLGLSYLRGLTTRSARPRGASTSSASEHSAAVTARPSHRFTPGPPGPSHGNSVAADGVSPVWQKQTVAKRAKKSAARRRADQRRAAKNAKRKQARKKAAGRSRSQVDEPPPLPDRRLLERALRDLTGGRTGRPIERAQDLMYSAWEAPSAREAVALAREALAISRDCADAYCLLAEYEARSEEEACELLREGVAAGERALGPQLFEDDVGHFWGLLETRPYMRARLDLAVALWSLAQHDEAIDHARDMLRLNPGDNQGVRHVLAVWLLELRRHDDLEELLQAYDGDFLAVWSYTRALLSFRTTGDSEVAREHLRLALEKNPHVPAFLLGARKLPRRRPDYIGVGDEREAATVAVEMARSWLSTPDALGWLRREAL